MSSVGIFHCFPILKSIIPDAYLDAVKRVMGEMGLDPAFEMSQWPDGRFFLNTYTWSKRSKLIPILIEEFEAGQVKEAIIVANNHCRDADWYQLLLNGTICFANNKNWNNKKRICVVYFGPNRDKFISEFSQLGNVVEKVNRRNP
ncbi:MAG: hypothetical protein ACQ9MH_27050 [Nitrospinales bacterium]